MEDKLTVIIPLYNREDKVKDTILSIENQTCKDFEILVIDDGSTDNSKKVIESLMKDYDNIRYIYKENGGVSSARNLGIKKSTTKYISFLDSDDLYEVDFVEKMLCIIRENDGDIAICGYYIEDDYEKRESKTKFISKDILYNYILGKNNFHTSTFVFKKEFIRKNNIYFYEDLSWGEDISFFIKAMSKTKNINLVQYFLTTYINKIDEKALSNFEIEKIDKDFNFVNRIINDKDINLSKKHREVLVNYKLIGLIVYRLLECLDRGYDINLVKKYYNKYKKYIENISMKQGLRSLKLFVNKQKLERLLK
ncbi:glycosyltransferase family 2 protein [Anaerococcus sp. AGMB00486]|uniref:Glycosyltransferase family 2 protein n=3 Tax=Anaerococcus TaxID=165779 RepID=A0ABX2NBA4_9FIRM|nr:MULTISPECIES: glycosyltransferase family 2 protein [Anaerococcus]MSS78180.1 glycosyltransferase family 2 protein [Anaerococcus porci]NVF11938.1 glycosyltransferase family 2 protein [Anaerococcus faecalis]